MLEITTELRTKFAKLPIETQNLLLTDLGFLTIATEQKQLEFVNPLLDFTSDQINLFNQKLFEKLNSEEYKNNLETFTKEMNDIVIPKAKKIIQKEKKQIEKQEQDTAETFIQQELNNL